MFVADNETKITFKGCKMKTSSNKVAIIGAGNVGCTFAYSLMISGIAREIVLIDSNQEKARGECMDLNHGASFVPPTEVYSAGFEGCKDANVVVITAGVKQKPGESRLDLVQNNVEAFKSIVPEIVKHTKDAVLLVVTNPVDILTYATLKISGLSSHQVFGSGTVLDSSRLRYLISEHSDVDPRNVHAYIIGEHGDTELPVWSKAYTGGMLLTEYCEICEGSSDHEKTLRKIFKEVKTAAYEIINTKGATYYAVGLALVRIVGAILRDENSVLPVSVLINDYYGIYDVCLSIPSVVNAKGIRRFLKIKLSDTEVKQFKHSAETLKNIIEKIDL